MRIDLAQPETRKERWERLRHMQGMSHLLDSVYMLAPDVDPDEQLGSVCATRQRAREFISATTYAHPLEGQMDSTAVELDCTWVECITGPYVSELLSAWPLAVFVNANEEVASTVAYIRERIARRT